MSYKISDAVAMRMIQIFQEALLLGVDGADLMRQVRVVVDEANPDTVTLDPSYESQVAEMHKKYLDEAETLKSKKDSQNVLIFE
jgi:low affinity Fe/Cu permease